MTALSVSTSSAASLRADALVVGVAKGPKGIVLAPGAEAVNEAFDGKLAEVLGTLGATGAEGETVKVASPAGLKAALVLAVGLGEAAEAGYELEALRRAAGVAARALAGVKKAALALPGIARVEIRCDQANGASAAVPRKLGYRLDRVTEAAARAPGETGRQLVWVKER